jgi:site-specific DNA recombinase
MESMMKQPDQEDIDGIPQLRNRSRKRPSRSNKVSPWDQPGVTARVVTYTRISTDELNQVYSLESQARENKNYIAKHPNWVLVKEYTDMMSGTKKDRPGLNQLLASAASDEFDILVILRVDRLSRNQLHLQQILTDFTKYNVRLVSVSEPFDANDPMGKFMLGMFGIYAEYEHGTLIKRIKAGNETKANRGEWVGGSPPFGYRTVQGKTLEIVESEAVCVREAFRLLLEENIGALNIAKRLNATGYRTRLNFVWGSDTVLNMLHKATYAGWITHLEMTIQGIHPPIIEPSKFMEAQKVLQINGASWQRASDQRGYKFAGLLRCTNCGAKMVGESGGGRTRKYHYYICQRRKKSSTTVCLSPRISADTLEAAVMQTITDLYRDYGLFRKAAEQAILKRSSELPDMVKRLKTIEKELMTKGNSRERFLLAFEDGSMPAEICRPRIQMLSTKITELEKNRDELKNLVEAPEPLMPTRREIAVQAKWIEDQLSSDTNPTQKALLKALIVRIEITPDRQVTPYLRVPHFGDIELKSAVLEGKPDEKNGGDANKTVVRIASRQVEVPGIEPGSFGINTGLLRA